MPSSSPVPNARGEQAGDVIDRYTLIEPLGEGGMGSVWRASQTEPVRRDVALKIIKLGMDTREVVVRFEAERQALALMDHPCIAKVYDGGATANGRPYFVMELVAGSPITQFCDQAQLGLTERLGLFIRVCDAIQHAHHKGVIHRDIKPSNVLVAMTDEGSVPKVIDFGVAKATSAVLTRETMMTEHAQIIGTPEYMAPEQAEMSGTDIDTRADVYALGALLYELLTGTKLFDLRRALSTGFDELLRQIREVEPQRPSTRLSSLGDTATSVAQFRGASVDVLRKGLTGDLDWIVMKALEKERERRYETANALAEDVGRFLAQEPVLAAPPSALYRLGKFVRRRKKTVAALAAITFVLIVGIVGTSWGLLRALDEAERADGEAAQKQIALTDAEQQRDAAQRELSRANEFKAVVADLFTGIYPQNARDKDTELLLMLLTRTSDQVLAGSIRDEFVAEEVHTFLGNAFNLLSSYERSEQHLAAALELAERHHAEGSFELEFARCTWAGLRLARGDADDAVAILEAVRSRHLGAPDEALLLDFQFYATLAQSYSVTGDHLSAEARLDEYFELFERHGGARDSQFYEAVCGLALAFSRTDRAPEAIDLIETWRPEMERVLGELEPITCQALFVLAEARSFVGETERAEALFTVYLGRLERTLAPGNAIYLEARSRYANMLASDGRPEEAADIYATVVDVSATVLGRDHRDLVKYRKNYAHILAGLGRFEEAQHEFSEAAAVLRERDGPDASSTLHANYNLACAYVDGGGHAAQAIALFVDLVPRLERVVGASDTMTLDAMSYLAQLLEAAGRLDESIEWSEEALAGRRKALGEDDPKVIDLLFTLAGRCAAAGRLEEAIAHYEETIERNERVRGPEDRWTLGAATNLAGCFANAGRIDESIELLERVSEVMARALGMGDPWTNAAFDQLATVYRYVGRADDAQRIDLRRLQLSADFVLANSNDAEQLVAFAEALLRTAPTPANDAERAVALARRAIEVAGELSAEPRATLARALFASGDADGAVRAAEAALERIPADDADGAALRAKIERDLADYRAVPRGY